MQVLYFDCFSGISGDMTIGALLDLGVDPELLKKELGKLPLDGYEIEVQKKVVHGIAGTDVEIHLPEDHADPERNLRDIEALIEASGLNARVKRFSRQVFQEIARAEAKVHNKPVDQVHFHEVGAVDSLVDIIGAAICLDLLGARKVYSSPLHEGRGFVACQHGLLPVPVPAVMEMLAASEAPIPIITEDINTELITPTGLGLIKCLAAGFGLMPPLRVNKVGYGFGKRETGRLNALRLVLGTLLAGDAAETAGREGAAENIHKEEIVLLETNIDDMSPEIIGYMMERLLANGALDVFHTPVFMKKNRPAVMVSVLAEKNDEKKLVDIVLTESTTLGIRRSLVGRYCLERRTVEIDSGFGQVRVKVAAKDGVKKFAPEYEDCKKAALEAGLPLREIYQMVMEKAKEKL